jgi:hypothetical protein
MNSADTFLNKDRGEQAKIITVLFFLIICIVLIVFYFNQVSGPMQLLMVVIAIFLFSYLIYISFSLFLLPPRLNRIGPDEIPLNKRTYIVSSETLKEAWSSTAGSTLMFYINPTIQDKTSQSGNEYATAVNIADKQKFEILISPDAGRGINMAAAQFKIKTVDTGTNNIERIDIPNFPLQRWTSVAIVKTGRRYNIFLNGKLSVSHTCKLMPDNDITSSLSVGDSRLSGKIGFMSISANSLNPSEIREMIYDTADSSGKPYLPVSINSMIKDFIPSLPPGFWCPGGNCNTGVPSPLDQWRSNYPS